MTPEQVGRILTRLDERTKILSEKIDQLMVKADNGGWSRCQINMRRLQLIEEHIQRESKSKTWKERTLVAALITAILSSIINFASSNVTILPRAKETITTKILSKDGQVQVAEEQDHN